MGIGTKCILLRLLQESITIKIVEVEAVVVIAVMFAAVLQFAALAVAIY